MRRAIHLLLAAALVVSLSACGTRGKLKSPTQIAIEEQKKAQKAAKQNKDAPAPAPADAAAEQE